MIEVTYDWVVAINRAILNKEFDDTKLSIDEAISLANKVNNYVLTRLTMDKIKTDAMVSICEQNPLYTPHLHAYLKKQEQVSEKIKTLRELWRAAEGGVKKAPPPSPLPSKEPEEPQWVLEYRKIERELGEIHKKIREAAVKGDEEKLNVLKKKMMALFEKQVKLYRESQKEVRRR